MWDTLVPRAVSIPNEQYIKGLRFCGVACERGDGYSSVYIFGMNTGNLTVKDAKEGM